MSGGARVSLMEVHSALSHLTFAVGEALRPLNVGVSAKWDQYTYLSVQVECSERDKQKVVDQLSHGVLQEPYDYRFRCSYPTGGSPTDWVTVSAYPNMTHDDNLHKAERAAAQ